MAFTFFEKESSGNRDRTASLACRFSSRSLGTMWLTLSASPSDTISNPSGEAFRAMWSLMLSEARIAWRSSSVRTVSFTGRLRLGTFGSLIPAVSTRAIRRVVFPTATMRRFLSSSWLREIVSPPFASRRISFILSMSTPSSPSSATSLRTSALTLASNKSSLPRKFLEIGPRVIKVPGCRRPGSEFPPRVLALHASIDARRRFVRGAGLPHDPERLVMAALRALDVGLRQRVGDLVEDEGLRGLLLAGPDHLGRGGIFPREGPFVPA